MDIEIVRSAYRKLKSYIYYDNANLLLRKKLSDFESRGNIDDELSKFCKTLEEEYPFNELLSEVKSYHVVKEFKPTETIDNVISNLRLEKEYGVNRINHFIDCPFELHLCAAIWTFEIGYKLQPKMAIEPYGNKLDIVSVDCESKLANGLKSYKPYFTQYQKWRDKAVSTAKELVERGKNSLVIGLDIKDFYNSVSLSFDQINDVIFPDGIPAEWVSICELIENIHKNYTELVKQQDSSDSVVLPIGLVSSGVLANYYLDPLDIKINKKLRPEYYGRYVDDILIVTSCPDDQDITSLEAIAKEYLVSSNVFEYDKANQQYNMQGSGYENISIQSSKLSVLHFSSNEPTALLDKFLADIKRNSSEYRLLPEDEVIEYDFDQSAYNLNYSGSGNKLRDIKEFGEDKFGISKYLAKKIFLALQSGHQRDELAVKKVLRFFKGKRAVELHSLWEKVFTFLMVNYDLTAVEQVLKELQASICAINESEDGNKLKEFYSEHLYVAFAMALALKPSILDQSLNDALEKIIASTENKVDVAEWIESLRKSNLIRHNYVVHPLLNYVGESSKGKFYDLIGYTQYFKLAKSKLLMSNEMYRYSPRFVNFHEVTLFHIINRISSGTSKFYKSGFHFGTSNNQKEQDYLIESANDFYKLNFQRTGEKIKTTNRKYKKIEKQLFDLESATKANGWTRTVKVSGDNEFDKLRVAIANLKINSDIFEHAYLRQPKIDPLRRKKFNSILNQAEEASADMLVLPEVSVPIAWFKWICDHALKKQRAIIFGLEHWVVAKRAFNYIVTLMPFTFDGYKSLAVNIRLKNHYSPGETSKLEGYGYITPEVKEPSYDLFNWQGCWFTAFNCFELSNIEHRARFRSKIDMLVASEFNADINYFSNLVEASARDIHCYVAQANDANYGDSRLTQPSKTVRKDLIKVKGGINPGILVEPIDFGKLREFQLKEYSGQKDFGHFKPTPPDFDKRNVIKRMKK